MILLRRCFVLAVLTFWLGGMTFYGGVVVPVGRHTIGSAQSQVTREVTFYLNLATLVAVPILIWDVFDDGSRRRRVLRWGCCAVVLLTCGLLIWMREQLAAMMDDHAVSREQFYLGHRAYLWLCTLQWLAAVLYSGLMLPAWRARDGSGQIRE